MIQLFTELGFEFIVGVGIGLNKLVAVLVPDFDDFVAHQIGVEDRDLVEGQVVKEDLPLVNLGPVV